jgi:hypothetical protein
MTLNGYRSGAMIPEGESRQWIFAAILYGSTGFNTLIIFFVVEYYSGYWPRFVAPLLMFIGATGRVRDIKWASFIGWAGIALFFLAALAASIPDPEIGRPKFAGEFETYFRYLIIFASTGVWVWSFCKLHPDRSFP